MLITELPKDRNYKYFQAAYTAAISSPGAGINNFKHGAVIVYKKDILAARFNCRKTHPKLLRFSDWPFLHAESHAIIAAGIDNCNDAAMYVVRILKNKHIALSKPCKSCQSLLTLAGINDIFYTIDQGYNKL